MAYPQADITTDIYMQPPTVPHNFIIPDLPQLSGRSTHVYKILKNLYGLKNDGKTWTNFLKKGLIKRGWVQSSIDERLFTKNGMLLILYVGGAYFISVYKHKIDSEIKSLLQEYDLTDDGDLKDYLGTRFDWHIDSSVILTQPYDGESI